LTIPVKWHSLLSVSCFGALMIRIAFISALLRIGWIPCLVIQYPRYYPIWTAKNLDLEIFILILIVESLARAISNLKRWYMKLLIVSINKSSRSHGCLNIFHILDKLRHEILKTSGTRKSWHPWVSICILFSSWEINF
jgi:hypothetical protein